MVLTQRHGHKTEERILVFNKNLTDKVIWKAQRGNILCLSTMVVTLTVSSIALSTPASAQANDVLNRLNRLENELDTLNRAVYRGEKPSTPVYNAQNATNTTEVTSAGSEVRLQQLESQLRDLTGVIEVQNYDVQQMKEQVRILSNRLDVQAKMQETQQTSPLGVVDIKPPEIKGMQTILPKGGNATALYERSFSLLKAEKFDEAKTGFDQFIEEHPEHALTSNAKYWLGETYYVQGKYDEAAKVFAQGFQKYPESPKAADNLLKLGMSLAGMGKVKDACVALSQVEVKFPTGHDNVIERANSEKTKFSCGA